jgi:hypothetical protein
VLIPSSVLAVHRVCAAESGKYPGTRGVRFEREPDGGCVAVATDTKRLLVCRWREPEDVPTFPEPAAVVVVPDFAAIVPAEVARVLEREQRQLTAFAVDEDGDPVQSWSRQWVYLEESATGGVCRLTLGLTGHELRLRNARVSVTCPAEDGKFVPWREVTADMDEKAGEPDAPVCLDPMVLSGLIEAAGLAAEGGNGFRLGFGPAGGKKIRLGRTSADKVVTVTGYMMPLAGEYRPAVT